MLTKLIGWSKDEYLKWAKDHPECARTTELRAKPGELRISFDKEPRKISGHAAVFNVWYRIDSGWEDFQESVAPGAFAKTIDKDDIRALFNHDPSKILARNNGTLTLREDSKGLYYEFIAPDTTDGNDLVTNIKLRNITQSSFGFNIVEQTLKHDKEKNETFRTLTEVKLFDVSPVTFPASPQTDVHVRMSVGISDDSGELIVVPGDDIPAGNRSDEQLFAEWEAVREAAIKPRERK